MAYELERKFLVTLPMDHWGVEIYASSAAEITQGYLSECGASLEVRARRVRVAHEGEDPEAQEPLHTMAIKSTIVTREEAALSRHEFEFPITHQEFGQAWRLVGNRHLHKRRVSAAVRSGDGEMLELVIDHFCDRHEGLVLAEIEFPSWRASAEFEPPGYLGTEVTYDRRFTNAALACARVRPPV